VNQNPVSPTQPKQPTTLTSASASTCLEYLLGFGGKPENSFGDLLIECRYDAAQLESFFFGAGGNCSAKFSITITCRTVIGGDWYAAEAVCAFAENALFQILGAEADYKTTVDAKACQVSCTFWRRHSEVIIQSLMLLGHRLLTFYSTGFSESVAKIHSSAELADDPVSHLEESLSHLGEASTSAT
jgi:hypothetical protein